MPSWKDWMMEIIVGGTPSFSSTLHKAGRGTESYVFFKSIYGTNKSDWCSRAFSTSCLATKIMSIHPLPVQTHYTHYTHTLHTHTTWWYCLLWLSQLSVSIATTGIWSHPTLHSPWHTHTLDYFLLTATKMTSGMLPWSCSLISSIIVVA